MHFFYAVVCQVPQGLGQSIGDLGASLGMHTKRLTDTPHCLCSHTASRWAMVQGHPMRRLSSLERERRRRQGAAANVLC